MVFDSAVLDRVKHAQPKQGELGDDEPRDDGRVYTLEDEFEAGEALLQAMRPHRLAKDAAKAKKEAEELAVEEWRRVHLQVRLARHRGEW